MIEQDLSAIKAKLEQLEAEIRAIKEVLPNILTQQAANPAEATPFGTSQIFDPEAAEAVFRQALLTLKTIATLRNERFIFIAAADSQSLTTSGPQPVQLSLTEELKHLLVKLGAALSNPTRIKMLFVLMAQEECTTALLAETTGVNGGNLFQQLNELHSANLIFQPSRGHYRLTEFGQLMVQVLSWGVSSVGRTWSQPGWFDNSSENNKTDYKY